MENLNKDIKTPFGENRNLSREVTGIQAQDFHWS